MPRLLHLLSRPSRLPMLCLLHLHLQFQTCLR
jgi:hypothetical protein